MPPRASLSDRAVERGYQQDRCAARRRPAARKAVLADAAAAAAAEFAAWADAGKASPNRNLETRVLELLLNVVRGYFTGSDVRGGGEDFLHEYSSQHSGRGIEANLEILNWFCSTRSGKQVRQCCHT
jgi:hypothetical protein